MQITCRHGYLRLKAYEMLAPGQGLKGDGVLGSFVMPFSTAISPLRRDNATWMKDQCIVNLRLPWCTSSTSNKSILREHSTSKCANGDPDAGTRIVPGVKAATRTSLLGVGSCVLWHACCTTATSPPCTCSASSELSRLSRLAQTIFSAGIRSHETKPMNLLGLRPKWSLLADVAM